MRKAMDKMKKLQKRVVKGGWSIEIEILLINLRLFFLTCWFDIPIWRTFLFCRLRHTHGGLTPLAGFEVPTGLFG